MKASKTWRRIGLALLAGLFSLALAEAALRVLGVRPSAERLEMYEFDATLGWRTRKQSRCYRSSIWYRHFSYCDRAGFATDRTSWKREPDPARDSVAFIGDSYVEGYYLPYEQTFTHLVGQTLGDKQILNLGVSGYSPDQYLLAARRHLPRYNAGAIVIVFFPYNDIPYVSMDRYHGYAKPLFGKSLDAPVNLPLKESRRPIRKGTLAFMESHSALAYLVAPLWKPHPPRVPAKDLQYTEKGMRAAMRFIKQIEVENPGRKVLVYYLPRYEEALDPALFEPNLRIFERICADAGLWGASPKRVFAERCRPRDFYRTGEGHLTPEGARSMAEDLCDLLRTNNVARPSGQ